MERASPDHGAASGAEERQGTRGCCQRRALQSRRLLGARRPGLTQLFPSQLCKWHGVAMGDRGGFSTLWVDTSLQQRVGGGCPVVSDLALGSSRQ